MAFAIFFTGDLLRECALSSRTSAFDQARRLVRLARLLAISHSCERHAAAATASIAEPAWDEKTTWATAPALAAKSATSTIPIVFALATDPIGSGLVESLARPGGNATGLSVHLAGKRLDLLREVVPDLRRLAIMANVGVSDTAAEMREVQGLARTLGLDVTALHIRRAVDIGPAFAALKPGTEALFVVGDCFDA